MLSDEQRDVTWKAFVGNHPCLVTTVNPDSLVGIWKAMWTNYLACAERLLPVIEAADEYIATLESQAVAVGVSATIIRMEKKAAYLKARDGK